MRLRSGPALRGLLLLPLLLGLPAAADPRDAYPERLGITPVRVPALDARKVALGRQLFGDVRLSRSNLSCASCHHLDRSGADGLARSIGADGRPHDFNTPTIFNVGLNQHLQWRGTYRDLVTENEAVLLNPRLMNGSWAAILPRLTADSAYRRDFALSYGREPDRTAVLDALVQFQRSLVTPDAPFDRYLQGDVLAISKEAEMGLALFRDLGCIACHQGRNVGGNLLQRFGVFPDRSEPGRLPAEPGDGGRYQVTGREEDRGLYRVPSLRNVAETAPYFHDGREPSLAGAVHLMGERQLGRTLTPDETALIVAFLRTLTGQYGGRPVSATAD